MQSVLLIENANLDTLYNEDSLQDAVQEQGYSRKAMLASIFAFFAGIT